MDQASRIGFGLRVCSLLRCLFMLRVLWHFCFAMSWVFSFCAWTAVVFSILLAVLLMTEHPRSHRYRHLVNAVNRRARPAYSFAGYFSTRPSGVHYAWLVLISGANG